MLKTRAKVDPKRRCTLCGNVARDTINGRPLCAECIKNGGLVDNYRHAFDDIPPIFGRRSWRNGED